MNIFHGQILMALLAFISNLSDCKGIGPKLASVVREALSLPYEITIRPKVQKARRGRVHK